MNHPPLNVLIMTNQAWLGRVIRIRVRPFKPKRRIPRISRTLILRPQRQNLCFSSSARSLCSGICITDIRQLITDTIGDDVRIQSFFLAFVDNGIDGLEGKFCVGAAVEPSFEFHGRGADSEVQAGDGGCYESGIDANSRGGR